MRDKPRSIALPDMVQVEVNRDIGVPAKNCRRATERAPAFRQERRSAAHSGFRHLSPP